MVSSKLIRSFLITLILTALLQCKGTGSFFYEEIGFDSLPPGSGSTTMGFKDFRRICLPDLDITQKEITEVTSFAIVDSKNKSMFDGKVAELSRLFLGSATNNVANVDYNITISLSDGYKLRFQVYKEGDSFNTSFYISAPISKLNIPSSFYTNSLPNYYIQGDTFNSVVVGEIQKTKNSDSDNEISYTYTGTLNIDYDDYEETVQEPSGEIRPTVVNVGSLGPFTIQFQLRYGEPIRVAADYPDHTAKCSVKAYRGCFVSDNGNPCPEGYFRHVPHCEDQCCSIICDQCVIEDGQGNVVADKAEGTSLMLEIEEKCKNPTTSIGSEIIDFKNKVNTN